MKSDWKKFIYFAVTVFVIYLAIHYWEGIIGLVKTLVGSSKSLIIGAVIAYIVNILMSFYEKHYILGRVEILQKGRRAICMVAAFITLIGVVSLLISTIVPELISCMTVMTNKIPGVIKDLTNYINHNEKIEDIVPKEILDNLNMIDVSSMRAKVMQFVTSGIGNLAGSLLSTVSSVFSSIITSFIAVIFAIYLLAGKEKLAMQSRKCMNTYLKPKWDRGIMYVLNTLNRSFHNFIVGQCTEAVILGVLCTVGMTLCRLPYATMIGALVGFSALIPVAGAYIGAGVGVFMIATISPAKALIFLIFIAILQQLEGNLIYPRVVGSSIGLPGLWVLAAVTIGGGMGGIVGMLCAVPVTASLYKILKDDVRRRELKS